MHSATYNHDERPCYSFAISQGDCEVDVLLDAATVEAAVGRKLVINPVLEGASLYLQMSSHGGGIEIERDANLSVIDLVETFLSGCELKCESRDLFAEAVVELEQHLRLAQRMVWSVGRDLGAIPDPMTPGYMPAMSQALKDIWDDWVESGCPQWK